MLVRSHNPAHVALPMLSVVERTIFCLQTVVGILSSIDDPQSQAGVHNPRLHFPHLTPSAYHT